MKIVKRKRSRGFAESVLPGIGISIALSIGIMLISVACIQNEYMNITTIPIVVIFAHIISTFIGSLIATIITKGKKIAVCAGVTGGYYLSMLGISVFVFEGIGTSVISGLLSCVAGGGGALILSTMEIKHIMRGRKKWGTR